MVLNQSSTERSWSPCSGDSAGPATNPDEPSKVMAALASPTRPGTCSVTPPLRAAALPFPLPSATAVLPVLAMSAWLESRP